ncbi:MAG: hypothetical protein EP332_06295 [Bacteroidetes bacterium]|nr:MAG: hypothetical protein EP332_06295 [Bacteroidota bacterium]
MSQLILDDRLLLARPFLIKEILNALREGLMPIEEKEAKLLTAQLRNGFIWFVDTLEKVKIREGLEGSYVELLTKIADEKGLKASDISEYDLHLYDTWFNLHPEKVCGVQKGTTSYSFPVTTFGTEADIINRVNPKRPNNPSAVKLKAKAAKAKLLLLEL